MKPQEGKFVRVSMTIMSCPICSFEQQVHITQKIKKCQGCHRNFKVPKVELIDISGTPHDVPFVSHGELITRGAGQ